jgi:hypothetical protein
LNLRRLFAAAATHSREPVKAFAPLRDSDERFQGLKHVDFFPEMCGIIATSWKPRALISHTWNAIREHWSRPRAYI